MINLNKIILIFVTLLSLNNRNLLAATDTFPYFCNKQLESLPIQQGGRVKPLYVHASEMVKFLSGKTSVNKVPATTIYCLLSFSDLAQNAATPKLQARIDHVDLRTFLSFKAEQKKISYNELLPQFNQISMEYNTQKEDSSYKKSMSTLLQKMNIYSDITSGTNWKVAVLSRPENVAQIEWENISDYLSEEKVKASNINGSDAFSTLLLKSKKDYITKYSDHYLLELTYAKMHLPVWALLVTILALAAFFLFKNTLLILIPSGISIILQITLITLRVLISGRAPVTNMYETVLFSGLGAFLLALIIGHFKKEKIFIFVGIIYNLCTLMMLNFAGGMLSAQIGPLVPVLRDNFWLSTHVTTIILSYGALALSWVLANTVLIKRRFFTFEKSMDKHYTDLIYTCLKFGTVLLAAGIILGGVWADYSWGRFWGWDPKETWSLIVLCIYIAILHGKQTSWIPPHRFIHFTAAAFMSVMMAWFGVNYILASGLHSYGFSQGGAIFLGSFFAIQILLLIITYKKKV